ncbi:MAG: CPBP family intramembrane glutamic endopeptidase [Gammaproteobacteria bacterium]
MNYLIHTPEIHFYMTAILVTWCLGGSNIATQIYSRWFATSDINPFVIQCAIKSLIVLMAMTVIPIQQLFSTSLGWQCLSIPLGIVGGYIVVKMELYINRVLLRKQIGKKPVKKPQDRIYRLYFGPKEKIRCLAPKIAKAKANLKHIHEYYAANESRIKKHSIGLLILTAILEEIIFRGYLTQFCFLLPTVFIVFGLIGTVLVFGFSHASFGPYQILAKSILGAVCLVMTLLCHTLVPAIIIHGYLNWRAYHQL